MDRSKLILIIISLAILCYYYMGQAKSTLPGGKKFTVYGTSWCGYTTKQREYLNKKYGKGSHTYVDCETGDCSGITAFPVTQTPSGEKIKGFNETL
jgi:hypothetical protein